VKKLLIVLSLALLPAVCGAENVFYTFGGQAVPRSHDLEIQQPMLGNYMTFKDVTYRDESFRGPMYYGFRYSHFFNDHPHWGLELEFFHPKAIANTDETVDAYGKWHGKKVDGEVRLDDYVQSWEVSHGYNMLLGNAAYRYGFFKNDRNPNGRLMLVARGGMGVTILHPESIVDDQEYYFENGHFEFNNIAFQISPGIEVNLYKGLNLFAEYKYTYTEIKESSIKYGDSSTVLETDHVAVGLAYHFSQKHK
jgi:hypothetical protein